MGQPEEIPDAPSPGPLKPTAQGSTSFFGITLVGLFFRLVSGAPKQLSVEEQRCLDNITNPSEEGEGAEGVEALVVNWNGPDDQENPHNWPSHVKIWVTFLISFYSFLVYCGASLVLPSYAIVQYKFHTTPQVVSLLMSVYVVGYGAGPLLFSPLSELPSVGRNPPYIISFVLFMIVSVIIGVLDNFPAIVVLRFFQGFFGSPCLATGGASITDIYSWEAIPYGWAAWIAFIYCGPALGPLFATRAVERLSWHWSFWEIAIMGAPLLVVMFVMLPETSSDTLLVYRARRLRQYSQNAAIKAVSKVYNTKSLVARITHTMIRPSEIALKDPAVSFIAVYCAFIYLIYYSFFESFPLVYIGVYKFSPIGFACLFLCIIVGTVMAAGLYIWYIRVSGDDLSKVMETNNHEAALKPALPAVCVPPIGLFLFAWTSRESIHWIVPTIGITVYGGSTFVVYMAVLIYITQSYPKYVASLLAVSDFSRSSAAAAFIHVGHAMFANLGIAHGVTILASISVLGIVGMFVLYRWGKDMRARSKFTG